MYRSKQIHDDAVDGACISSQDDKYPYSFQSPWIENITPLSVMNKIIQIAHFQEVLYPGQGGGRLGAYPRNAGRDGEVGDGNTP